MKFYYDLHIHSCLSPCGDEDMTPNNIVNMSVLKGLDFIAVTDHNSILNLEAVINCSKNTDVKVIPGMEIETSEEIHMLSLFPNLIDAENCYDTVSKNMLGIKNRPDIFGRQLIMNDNDEITGIEDMLLVTATKLNLDKVKLLVENNHGICIPAHIDRNSYSIISNLGTIPDIGFSCVELSKNADFSQYNNYFYKKIRNSDAHYLEDIFEADNYVDIEEKSIECLFSHLK